MVFDLTEGSPPIDSTVSDVDGNVYETVVIGNQIWMKENLNTTHYRNGDPIPTMLTDQDWSFADYGAYADYNHDVTNSDVYGRHTLVYHTR